MISSEQSDALYQSTKNKKCYGKKFWKWVFKSTGEKAFLDRATHFAQWAEEAYFDETSPLPKADPDCHHYENVTRADTLLLAMLKLHVLRNDLPVEIGISDLDR